jgi:hypothetical protein
MAIEWENGFVKRIALGGVTGTGWGIAVCDRRSSFTLAGTAGCTATDLGCASLPNGFRREVELAMAEGRWLLTLEATSWRGMLRIHQHLESLADSILTGVAIDVRFDRPFLDRVPIDDAAPGAIGGLRHWSVPHVTLAGATDTVQIRTTSTAHERALLERLALRDNPESWAVRAELVDPMAPPDGGRSADETAWCTHLAFGEAIQLTVDCEFGRVEPEVYDDARGAVWAA